jgi:hypothetical protein
MESGPTGSGAMRSGLTRYLQKKLLDRSASSVV